MFLRLPVLISPLRLRRADKGESARLRTRNFFLFFFLPPHHPQIKGHDEEDKRKKKGSSCPFHFFIFIFGEAARCPRTVISWPTLSGLAAESSPNKNKKWWRLRFSFLFVWALAADAVRCAQSFHDPGPHNKEEKKRVNAHTTFPFSGIGPAISSYYIIFCVAGPILRDGKLCAAMRLISVTLMASQ